jgi:O-antigen biosynthesis protein
LKYVRLVKYSRLFDRAFYLGKYPDLAAAGVNPLLHYVQHGASEGRKPHSLFDPDYYLRRNPEARGSGLPLLHFIEKGGRSGMSPHPLFDGEAYLRANPEAAAARVNALIHSLRKIPLAAEGSQFGCVS